MTKSRKIGISVSLILIFVLACAVFVPLYRVDNANVANAATVKTRDEWTNSYTSTYYDNLNEDLLGAAFRSELAKLITHTKNPTYDNLKELYKTTDVDPQVSGNVIWFYTGNSVPYTGAMDSGNYRTNREHVWPKMAGSAFPETSEAGSDAHHVRPLNTKLNNTRSNYHFGEVKQSSSARVLQDGPLANYGTEDNPDSWCYLSGGYFYPAEGYRGATARILFYVQTRWGDRSSLSFTLGKGSAKVMSNVDILLKWHLQEPPTEEEVRRNEAVYKIQGNRNPFIDHPEYAEMIYCYDGNSYNNALQDVVDQYGSYLNDNDTAPTSITLSVSSLDLTVGSSSSKITVTANPSDASNRVRWTTSDSRVATVNNGVVTAVKEGTATITATSTLDSNVKASLTVNVTKIQLSSLSISPGSLSLATGGTRQLTVTASPAGASNSVSWTTSDSSVATVNNGLVKAVSSGTATITAISTDNPNIKASITVTVTSQEQNNKEFADSLQAIESAKSLEERYNAIKSAIDSYNQMTSEQKSANASGYEQLKAALKQYNEEIAQINGEFESANSLAAHMLCGISTSFMALVALVIKRISGGM